MPILNHKHHMSIYGTKDYYAKLWTWFRCDKGTCTFERFVEHGWFKQKGRGW